MKRILFPLGLLAVATAMIALFLTGNSGEGDSKTAASTKASSEGLPGLITGPLPWKSNSEKLSERLLSINLPKLSSEGTVLHIHQHLDLYINGKKTDIPANIGIPTPETFISDLHTHAIDGIIHVESPKQQDFTLGQFFDVWGVKLSKDQVGGYKTDAHNLLSIYVNGKKIATDPRQLKLEAHQEIVVAYGNDTQLPAPVPASFDFAPNL